MPTPDPRSLSAVRDLLSQAMHAHRDGRLDDAASGYSKVLTFEPENAEALQLLGLIAHRQGRHAEAVARMDRALAADPEHAPAWANRGLALRALGDLDGAATSLRRALVLRPGMAEALLNLARVESARGDKAAALAAAGAAVSAGARREGFLLQASLLGEAGRWAEAARAMEGAIQETREAQDPRLWLWAGQAWREANEPDHAEAAWRRALALPGCPIDAAVALGGARLRAGDAAEAVVWLSKAVEGGPADRPTWIAFADAVSLLSAPGPELVPALAAALARDDLDHQRLERAIRTLLGRLEGVEALLGVGMLARGSSPRFRSIPEGSRRGAEPQREARLRTLKITSFLIRAQGRTGEGLGGQDLLIRASLRASAALRDPSGRSPRSGLRPWRQREHLDTALSSLLAHPLFLPWLRQTLVAHPGWERLLGWLRLWHVKEAAAGRAVSLPLLEALAIQAWNTEYPSVVTRAAVRLADRLGNALAALELGAPLSAWEPGDLARLAAFASLRPLRQLPRAERMLQPGWEVGPLAALVRQQLAEPAEEAAIEPTIPTLTRTEDSTSQAVRAQYEESPYPRLLHVHRRTPTSLSTLMRSLFPHFTQAPHPDGRLQVLVAGCGTGQHALTTATRLADADVLAVDLSRPSLARATRAARAWGLENLRFAEADILALGQISERFHVMESVGVLHHLADPAAGLAALTGRLLPGGMLQLGLYSALGRRDVEAARALLAECGLDASPDGIRAARALLARLPESHPAHPVVWSPDFTSLSGCRDLLFHVCEHRFSACQIQDLLAENGLVFVGFQHARPEIATLYRERFPDDPNQTDLGRWDALEKEHPRVFSGMYVFWCYKPG